MSDASLHAVSWNLTRRCNLKCSHCYLDAAAREGAGDLSTEQCLRIVDELAQVNPNQLLILTGGEPLLRKDLGEIARAAVDTGMTVVVGTNGTMLDERAAGYLQESGVSGVGISVDSAPDPERHDRLRGREGSWDGALQGIAACKRVGLEFLVQTSVFQWNRGDLPAVAELAAEHGARAWNVYFLVCTGRGQELTDLTPAQYEDTLHEVRRIQKAYADRLLVAVRCAPQYRRVVAEEAEPSAAFHAYPSGCPAAMHYLRVGPRGEVTPCPYMETEAGRLGGEQSFRDIWERSPTLLQLRDRSALGGKCGPCSYRDTCGGCRARALAVLGDAMAEDPSCAWDPATQLDAPPPAPEATFALPDQCTMPWTREACERLARAPSFLHGMVIKRVEAEARDRGFPEVTAELMKEVRARSNNKGGGIGGMFSRFRGGKAAPAEPAQRSEPSGGPIVWSPEALRRLQNAPDFVREGIRKLMTLRAGQRGITVIDSDLLSEIRDESMMRVSRIMRRFGLTELRPDAFDEARRRMAKKPNKVMLIDQIQHFVQNKQRNEPIREKFRMFLEEAGGKGQMWMPDATERIERLPEFARAEMREAIEAEAKRINSPVVTRGVVERVIGPQKEHAS